MEKNEIKKALYKQKPMAQFTMIRKEVAYYQTTIVNDDESSTRINFEIPVGDMGDADYYQEMDAKLLNRYIVI